MSRSPVISTLLILTLCIVCEVTSAPREERIREESVGEKFLETREAEVLERRSGISRYENFGKSREDEMRKKRMTLVQVPSPSVYVEEKKTATKKPIVGKPKDNLTSTAETSEAKDMRQSYVAPKDDDDSAIAETVPVGSEKNSTSVGQRPNKILPETSPEVNNETPKDVADKENDKVDEKKDQTKEKSTVAPSGSTATPIGKVTVSTVPTEPSTIHAVTSETSTTSPAKSASTVNTPTTVAIDSPVVNTTDVPTTTTMNALTTTTMNTPTTTTTMNTPTTTTTMNAPTAASTSISTEAITPTGTSAVVTTSSSTNSQSITDVSMTSSSTETYSSAAEAALHAKHSTSMPPGVIALVIAIAFACVSVMAYIGLVVWRRYLEWRYGNRELLVNEFDANDISNFEL